MAQSKSTTRPKVDGRHPILAALVFKREHRCFAEGTRLEFRKGVNLLVGDQGSGKSTVLQAINAYADSFQRPFGGEETRETFGLEAQRAPLHSFDFEHSNPRTLPYLLEAGTGFQIASKFKSHGETVNAILASLDTIKDPNLILLDEPDMALSPRSAHELARQLEALAKQGHQVIAAVHNPIVIASQPEVYSLEHQRWLDPQDFLERQATEPRPLEAVATKRAKGATKTSTKTPTKTSSKATAESAAKRRAKKSSSSPDAG